MIKFPKIGVLGAGQLGKMLCQAASPWELSLYCLDKSSDSPAAAYCKVFTEGDFKQYEDVLHFGREMDIITIEIEHVNTDALFQLEKEGKTIHPAPSALEIIKDKGLQKQFYAEHQIPTSPFQLLTGKVAIIGAIERNQLKFPFVQKTRKAGYDGKGVAVIHSKEDIATKLLEGPSLIEDLVEIDKELAIIVAQNKNGDIQTFDPVEMEFHPEANLVEYLLCPANITSNQSSTLTSLAIQIIKALDICGILAVEFFLTKNGSILVNEMAPRPHNSGHHTIDSAITSQYEQHLRGILNLPLGSTQLLQPAVMVNLLGHPNHQGPAVYKGLEECLQLSGVHLHIYGKTTTKPYRKMGHATIMDADIQKARRKAQIVKKTLEVISI